MHSRPLTIKTMNSQYQKITCKDLSTKMGVSIKTAERYLKDIKEEFKIKIVLEYHIQLYFKTDAKLLAN
ncbi:HTH domain-containing protein [Flavobacterium sp.]|uniref:HTH domain-containing protein n=1 Tax=Flavobacterium sp. TaxID=239 RepID=UPI002636A965|nr:HTH domain-containing protein [Flavobacterium sp.]